MRPTIVPPLPVHNLRNPCAPHPARREEQIVARKAGDSRKRAQLRERAQSHQERRKDPGERGAQADGLGGKKTDLAAEGQWEGRGPEETGTPANRGPCLRVCSADLTTVLLQLFKSPERGSGPVAVPDQRGGREGERRWVETGRSGERQEGPGAEGTAAKGPPSGVGRASRGPALWGWTGSGRLPHRTDPLGSQRLPPARTGGRTRARLRGAGGLLSPDLEASL